MQIAITQNAENDLEALYGYHADYSIAFADSFHDEIVTFIIDNLSQFPAMGREEVGQAPIRKLVYKAAFNIYYTVRDETAFILYILDGRRFLNEKISLLGDDDVDGLIG